MSGTEKVKELLNRSNILIKDHELALKKILSIRAGGASKLQVLNSEVLNSGTEPSQT